jgi:hypothetical protein
MKTVAVLLKLFLPPLLAFLFARKDFDLFIRLVSFFLLWFTFGLIVEALAVPIFKLLKLKVDLKPAVFYTFAATLTVFVIFLYNKTRPVVARLVFIGNGKICADNRCLTFKDKTADVFSFRKPVVVFYKNKRYRLKGGIYLLNSNGKVKAVLHTCKVYRKLFKHKEKIKVESKPLGVYERGFYKLLDNASVEVYVNENPPEEQVAQRGEILEIKPLR